MVAHRTGRAGLSVSILDPRDGAAREGLIETLVAEGRRVVLMRVLHGNEHR